MRVTGSIVIFFMEVALYAAAPPGRAGVITLLRFGGRRLALS